jgi:hypothetical protein
MSNKSLKEAFAPLKAWSAQPPTPFGEIGAMLEQNSGARLGFWSGLGLSSALLVKDVVVFRFVMSALVIAGIAGLFIFGRSNTQITNASASTRSIHPLNTQQSNFAASATSPLNTTHFITRNSGRSILPHVLSNEKGSVPAAHLMQPETVGTKGDERSFSIEKIAKIVNTDARESDRVGIQSRHSLTQIAQTPNDRRMISTESDASGFVFGVGTNSSAIPSENTIAGRPLRETEFSIGYQIDAYHKFAIAYGKQTFRRFNETSHTVAVINVSTGTTSYVRTVSHEAVDNLIAISGISYTFNIHNLRLFSLEPAVTGFAGLASAGFVWRGGAEIAWNPIEHFNLIASYQYEKLNSVDYSALQSQRALLGLSLDYRW